MHAASDSGILVDVGAERATVVNMTNMDVDVGRVTVLVNMRSIYVRVAMDWR
jgi:hypothetical protein